ncbi:hypothetical protein ACH61_03030 [Rathayibacter tanaceti]|uniref:Uncharacterized protein n=1 Tax=Rathayibacter tanaceti TaxID=1671680 RepID=A0A162GMD0_9MICO|nr:hypothetical protein ACH61_03030 [Rathayibacter tanaceti]
MHIRHLVRDVAVHAAPVPVAGGLLPGGEHEVHPALEQGLGVGEHAVDAAHAELVELRGRAGDAPEDPVAPGVLVGGAEDRGGRPRAEGEARELTHEVLAVHALAAEAIDGVDLDLVGVLAVDDHGVADLTRVDELRGEGHAVHEPEAGVGDVEVDGRRGQSQTVVQAHGDRRLEMLARDRGVDDEPDLIGADARLIQSPLARVDRCRVETLLGAPVAALVHPGDALEQARGESEAFQRRSQARIDLGRGGHSRSHRGRDGQQCDVAVRGRCVSVQRNSLSSCRSWHVPPRFYAVVRSALPERALDTAGKRPRGTRVAFRPALAGIGGGQSYRERAVNPPSAERLGHQGGGPTAPNHGS